MSRGAVGDRAASDRAASDRAASDRAASGHVGADRVVTGAAPHELPTLVAAGEVQMAIDDALLDEVRIVVARRYEWSPSAVSLGKFQKVEEGAARESAAADLTVVRRPTGGRAVLHGRGFEWSFAVVFPRGGLPYGSDAPYEVVAGAFAGALTDVGVIVDAVREAPYERSPLCFATALRHDLAVGGEKVVALAQARRAGRVLVHGSVLERRPPPPLVAAIEDLVGRPWRGEGLAGAGCEVEGEALWRAFVARLSASPLLRLSADDEEVPA
jgi:lipoate-protein ligase A